MKKLIDVIIPAFNAHKTIMRTLGSIMSQTIIDKISITIVNDCGETYNDIVSLLQKFIDIKEIDLEKNVGPGLARQIAIESTTCPYIVFIDADDTFSNSYAVETLYKNMILNPKSIVCAGKFIEENEPFLFYERYNNLIWLFGIMYKRDFIEENEIKFSETRSNEDNGYNTFIRLCSNNEKILHINEVIYHWHYTEGSITRKNNKEYSYNENITGYIDNMIYAIENALVKKPDNNFIYAWAIEVMAHIYLLYYRTVKNAPQFKNQNFYYAVKYYNKIYKNLSKKISETEKEEVFSIIINGQAENMIGIVPDLTIYQFIKQLKENGYKE